MGRNVTRREPGYRVRRQLPTTLLSNYTCPFRLLAGFPVREFLAKDEEFATDLYNGNAVLFNDSAEMANREACHFCGRRNVQKHLRSWLSCSCGLGMHRSSSLSIPISSS